MKNGRRGFLKGMLGVAAVATTQVFAEKQEPEVLQEKFEQVLEKPEFNAVILEYHGTWNHDEQGGSQSSRVKYRAVNYVGTDTLQRGDMVVWADDKQAAVELYAPNLPYYSKYKGHYAGVVTICATTPSDIPIVLSERATKERELQERSPYI